MSHSNSTNPEEWGESWRRNESKSDELQKEKENENTNNATNETCCCRGHFEGNLQKFLDCISNLNAKIDNVADILMQKRGTKAVIVKKKLDAVEMDRNGGDEKDAEENQNCDTKLTFPPNKKNVCKASISCTQPNGSVGLQSPKILPSVSEILKTGEIGDDDGNPEIGDGHEDIENEKKTTTPRETTKKATKRPKNEEKYEEGEKKKKKKRKIKKKQENRKAIEFEENRNVGEASNEVIYKSNEAPASQLDVAETTLEDGEIRDAEDGSEVGGLEDEKLKD